MANTPYITRAIGNQLGNTLASAISDTDTSIELSDATGFDADGGYVIIDENITGKEEIVYIESVAGTILTASTDGRGRMGTTAVAHDAGATVSDILVTDHINGIADRFLVEHNDDGTHKDDIVDTVYPVGSIYISVNSTNPGTLFGVGTWVAFGAGKVLVGLDSSDAAFDTVEETGGAKTVTLSSSEIPSHSHSVDPPSTSTSSNGLTLTVGRNDVLEYIGSGAYLTVVRPDGYSSDGNVSLGGGTGSHSHTVDIGSFTSGTAGTGGAHNNLQPYVVVYMFKRTA
jgi:microcystin-dependent protein